MSIPTMIVDDQDDIRVLIRMLISVANDGLQVACEASSGPEALAKIACCDPRVVVLDEMMPGMNGVETATRIRARRPQQLVILCSAYVDDDVERRALAAGIAAVVPKESVGSIPALIQELVAS